MIFFFFLYFLSVFSGLCKFATPSLLHYKIIFLNAHFFLKRLLVTPGTETSLWNGARQAWSKSSAHFTTQIHVAGWNSLRLGWQEMGGTHIKDFWGPSLNLQGSMNRIPLLNSDGLAEGQAQWHSSQMSGTCHSMPALANIFVPLSLEPSTT